MAVDKRATTIKERRPAGPRHLDAAPAPRFARPVPDEAACLEWLKNTLYPAGIVCRNRACAKHGEVAKHHRVLSRRSYCCAYCGHHVHPTAGTIFHKSPTPLRLWFYAIYLMTSTRCEVLARELQRQLQVTYKTAWRMSTQIRALLDEPARPAGEESKLGWAIARFVEAHILDANSFETPGDTRGRLKHGATQPGG